MRRLHKRFGSWVQKNKEALDSYLRENTPLYRKARKLARNPKAFYTDSAPLQKTKQHLLQLYFWNPAFFITVILPILMMGFYYAFWCSDRYVSNAGIVIRQNDNPVSKLAGLTLLGDMTGGSTNNYMLAHYIKSQAMLNVLDKKLNLKKVFQNRKVDFFSRLSHHALQEDFLSYYQKHVSVTYDPQSSLLTLSVQAYDAAFSLKLAQEIINESKNVVNKVSSVLAHKRLEFTQHQLASAHDKLYQAETDIINFQQTYHLFDPEATVTDVSKILATLEGQLVEKETQLINDESYMQPSASPIVALKAQIKAIKQQIQTHTHELIGHKNGGDKKLNSIMANYEWLKLNISFSEAEYKASQEALEAARLSVAQDENQLVVLEPPTLADEALYPRVWYNLTTLFIVLLLLYGIGRITVSIIQEHRL